VTLEVLTQPPTPFSLSAPQAAHVEIRRHGRPDPWTYAMLDQRQREVARRVREEDEAGALLLNEVAPVITRGRRTEASDVTAPSDALAATGIELYPVDRGGFATYHGPGQWVLFAVDRLERLTGDRRGVRKAVEALLETALEAGRLHDPSAEIRSGAELGVWGKRGKFAAVGIHIEQGVLLHGLSVNAFRTRESFYGLRPCGLDAPVSFLFENKELGEISQASLEAREADFEALGRSLLNAASKNFYR
jgi:lipoyl(octanoyl) transferase